MMKAWILILSLGLTSIALGLVNLKDIEDDNMTSGLCLKSGGAGAAPFWETCTTTSTTTTTT